MAVTIKDVARAANVSVSTVSRVTNNASNVSPEVRRKVLAVISKMGYTPSVIAKNMGARSLQNIAIVMGRTRNQAFYNTEFIRMVDGICTVLDKYSYNSILCTNEDRETEMEHCINLVATGTVQGVIMIGAFQSDRLLERLVEKEATVVLIGVPSGQPDIHSKPYNFVGTDDYHDCYSATRYLLDAGHRRIGLIYSSLEFQVNKMRRKGYMDAITDAGLPLSKSLMIEATYDKESCHTAALLLLSQEKRPTAIFCTDDYKAAYTLCAAAELGIDVPGDVSVMGHNDYDLCGFVYPNLTTVHVPLTHLGRTAAELVMEMIIRPSGNTKSILLTTHIVERDSVRSLPVERTHVSAQLCKE